MGIGFIELLLFAVLLVGALVIGLALVLTAGGRRKRVARAGDDPEAADRLLRQIERMNERIGNVETILRENQ
jgi:hypothetical protein